MKRRYLYLAELRSELLSVGSMPRDKWPEQLMAIHQLRIREMQKYLQI